MKYESACQRIPIEFFKTWWEDIAAQWLTRAGFESLKLQVTRFTLRLLQGFIP